jgi:hypothetical protein
MAGGGRSTLFQTTCLLTTFGLCARIEIGTASM